MALPIDKERCVMRSSPNRRSTSLLALAVAMSASLLAGLIGGGSTAASTLGYGSEHPAAASSVGGSSCQSRYRYVKDLRGFYHPPRHNNTNGNNDGPGLIVRTKHIGASMSISYGRYEPGASVPISQLPITSVVFSINWWNMSPGTARICTVKITFHGLRTFVSHRAPGVHTFVFHHIFTDRPLKLEITAG
jgi:hypothetical protein